MMTAAFDDTVDILHVVHDKALMKEMIAAQTVFPEIRPERKISSNAALQEMVATMCSARCHIE